MKMKAALLYDYNTPLKVEEIELDNLSDYYQVRGWDENGKPTPEKLKELGLEDIVKHLN